MSLKSLSVAGTSINITVAFSYVHNIKYVVACLIQLIRRYLTDLNVMKNELKEADIDILAKIINARESNRKLNLCDTGFGKYPEKSVDLIKVIFMNDATLTSDLESFGKNFHATFRGSQFNELPRNRCWNSSLHPSDLR